MREEYKGYVIKIEFDPEPQNPRTECDNATMMVCFHKRYALGDWGLGFHGADYNSWFQLEVGIRDRFDGQIAAILPIYMYDHSGITIKTTPFACPWDSGQIGFVFMTMTQALVNIGKLWTVFDCVDLLRSEVAAYDKYLRGEAYGYIIEKDGEETVSCWGFDDEDYCLKEAKNAVDYRIQAIEEAG